MSNIPCQLQMSNKNTSSASKDPGERECTMSWSWSIVVCVQDDLWIGNGTLCVDHSTYPLIIPTTVWVIPSLYKASVEVDTQSPIPILGHIITTIMISASHT